MKKNPMRVIAILCGLVLIYITILFVIYSIKDSKPRKQSQANSNLTYTKYL
ncbi:MAG: hypothetical protein ABI594_12580 [Ginsengibacter sp.]